MGLMKPNGLVSTVDLHIHTVASDGAHTPQEIVAMARVAGLRVIAITDHDALDSVPAALDAAADGGPEVIPGVEISCEGEASDVHILAYHVDWHNAPLRESLARSQYARVGRAQAMLERLRNLGIELSWDRVLQLAGDGAIGRPHIAAALAESHHVGSVREAFDLYLARDRPAFVSRLKLAPEEAIQLVRGAGGVPVLAHPWGLEQAVPGLVRAGLAGLEAYYAGYPEEVVADLRALAGHYGLVTTGGSDFHGLSVIPERTLGSARVPASSVPSLADLHRRIVAEG